MITKLKLKHFIILILSTFFVYQSYKGVSDFVSNPTAMKTGHKKLSDVKPPTITICPSYGFDNQALEKFGYVNYYSFLIGVRTWPENDPETVYGWVGEGTGKKSVQDVLDEVCIVKNVSSVVNTDVSVMVLGDKLENEMTQDVPIKFKKVFKYPICQCLQVELDQFTDDKVSLSIFLKDLENKPFNIFISDPYMEFFLPNQLTFFGDYVEVEKGMNFFYTYRIKLTVIEEDIKDGDCQEYDDDHTFKDCIDNYAGKIFDDKLGCVPPWFSKDINRYCNKSFTQAEFGNTWKHVRHLVYQEHFKDCLAPCTRMEITSRMQSKTKAEMKGTGALNINFDEKVKVVGNVLIMNFLDLLANIGGILGLCLGLSFLDMLNFFSFIASQAKSYYHQVRPVSTEITI